MPEKRPNRDYMTLLQLEEHLKMIRQQGATDASPIFIGGGSQQAAYILPVTNPCAAPPGLNTAHVLPGLVTAPPEYSAELGERALGILLPISKGPDRSYVGLRFEQSRYCLEVIPTEDIIDYLAMCKVRFKWSQVHSPVLFNTWEDLRLYIDREEHRLTNPNIQRDALFRVWVGRRGPTVYVGTDYGVHPEIAGRHENLRALQSTLFP